MPDIIFPGIKKYDEALLQADQQRNKLLIQFSSENFTFVIFNQDFNKFLSFESVNFHPDRYISEINSQLEEFCTHHQWLKQHYQLIKILLVNNQSTLIPAPLFDADDKGIYSKLNFADAENQILLYDKLNNLDAYIIYPFTADLIKTITNIFPNHISYSYTGTLIESLLILNKNQPDSKRFYVNVRDQYLDIVIITGRKLLYFNTFKFTSKEDFIYYVIFVLEQLQLNPEEIEMILSGNIDRNSKLFETIYKYIRHVNFQEKPELFALSYIFDDLPLHLYSGFINFELCEL